MGKGRGGGGPRISNDWFISVRDKNGVYGDVGMEAITRP